MFLVCIEPGRFDRVIGKGEFRIGHVDKRQSVKIQLPERIKPDAQILVTGLKVNARAAVAELELMANLMLRPEHILVSLQIKHDENILVLGPEGCRAAWIERNFGVRFVRLSGNMSLMLEGGVEAVTKVEAFIEQLVAKRLLTNVSRY